MVEEVGARRVEACLHRKAQESTGATEKEGSDHGLGFILVPEVLLLLTGWRVRGGGLVGGAHDPATVMGGTHQGDMCEGGLIGGAHDPAAAFMGGTPPPPPSPYAVPHTAE